MTFGEFILASQIDQERVIAASPLIMTLADNDRKRELYQHEAFYIELVHESERITINAFTSTDLLDPYLNYISI